MSPTFLKHTSPTEYSKHLLISFIGAVTGSIILFVTINAGGVEFEMQGTQLLAAALLIVGLAIWIALALSYVFFLQISRRKSESTGGSGHDALTGLSNRECFHERLAELVQQGKAQNFSLSLLIMDLDRFKEVNDTLSHRTGDELLQQVASRIVEVTPDAVTRCRLGGDEFAILLRAEEHSAMIAAKKIQSALEIPILLDDIEIEIRASIGIALFPDHGVTDHELFRRAEVAMYNAKRHALGSAVYSSELDPYNVRRLTLLGELRSAMENQQLLLHYQPKIDLTTNRAVGVEALLRWKHPQHGLIPPGEFIPIAEQSDLIHNLTYWVMDEALLQCHVWRQMGYTLNVALNLSPRNLHNPGFPIKVGGLLAKWAVPASGITLEITENAIMIDPERALKILLRLNHMGVNLSIDDFGTGYSSLLYLKRLPVSQIKVDRSFVMDMTHDNDDAIIVQSTIDLGHNMNCQVVAEGVENKETLERLRRMGCDQIQGYYLSRPLPADEITAWFAHSNWGLSALPNAAASR